MALAGRLQTYAPSGHQNDTARQADARKAKAAWDDGYEAGILAGAEAAATEAASRQDQLSERIVELVADLRTERAEAQAQLLAAFGDTMGTIVALLAPRLARAGLADHVRAQLDAALATRPATMPDIRCAPEIEPALAALAQSHADSFTLTVDPTLTPLEARVIWDDGFDQIALDPALEAILAEIDAALPAQAASPDAAPDHSQEETRDVG